MADFEIKGGAELEAALRDLPVKLEKNVLRGALRAGAKTFLDEAKLRVPVQSGKLRDSLRISTRVLQGKVMATVTAGGGRSAVFYAHFVEHGTAPHVIIAGGGTKAGKVLAAGARILGAKVDHPGAVAKPFMRPAFDTKAQTALDQVAQYIRERLGKLDQAS